MLGKPEFQALSWDFTAYFNMRITKNYMSFELFNPQKHPPVKKIYSQ
jgi:hypothetical protein